MGYLNKNLAKVALGSVTTGILATIVLIFIDWGFTIVATVGARILISIAAVIGAVLSKEIYNLIKYGMWNSKNYD